MKLLLLGRRKEDSWVNARTASAGRGSRSDRTKFFSSFTGSIIYSDIRVNSKSNARRERISRRGYRVIKDRKMCITKVENY
jgi:hypothetical protein